MEPVKFETIPKAVKALQWDGTRAGARTLAKFLSDSISGEQKIKLLSRNVNSKFVVEIDLDGLETLQQFLLADCDWMEKGDWLCIGEQFKMELGVVVGTVHYFTCRKDQFHQRYQKQEGE